MNYNDDKLIDLLKVDYLKKQMDADAKAGAWGTYTIDKNDYTDYNFFKKMWESNPAPQRPDYFDEIEVKKYQIEYEMRIKADELKLREKRLKKEQAKIKKIVKKWQAENWILVPINVNLEECEGDEKQEFLEFWSWFGANISGSYEIETPDHIHSAISEHSIAEIKEIFSIDVLAWYIRFDDPDEAVLYKLTWYEDNNSE